MTSAPDKARAAMSGSLTGSVEDLLEPLDPGASVRCRLGPAEVPGEEPDRAVRLEPRQLLVGPRVGVQRLLRRGEGVEQRETRPGGLASRRCASDTPPGTWRPLDAPRICSVACSGDVRRFAARHGDQLGVGRGEDGMRELLDLTLP